MNDFKHLENIELNIFYIDKQMTHKYSLLIAGPLVLILELIQLGAVHLTRLLVRLFEKRFVCITAVRNSLIVVYTMYSICTVCTVCGMHSVCCVVVAVGVVRYSVGFVWSGIGDISGRKCVEVSNGYLLYATLAKAATYTRTNIPTTATTATTTTTTATVTATHNCARISTHVHYRYIVTVA